MPLRQESAAIEIASRSLAGLRRPAWPVRLPALAADVGVSVQISQPGVYGRIDIGRFPQPQVVVPQPVHRSLPAAAAWRSRAAAGVHVGAAGPPQELAQALRRATTPAACRCTSCSDDWYEPARAAARDGRDDGDDDAATTDDGDGNGKGDGKDDGKGRGRGTDD